jgi:hypothetical protein
MFVPSLPTALARLLLPCLLLFSVGCELFTSPTGDPTPAQEILLTAVSPNRGSTGGGSSVVVTGSGFRLSGGNRGTSPTVTLGGIKADSVSMHSPLGPDGFVLDRTALYFTTPPHAAGAVDLVVTNPGDLPATLRSAYTYASPASFDFNGDWWGWVVGTQQGVHFIVRNDRLVSVTCVVADVETDSLSIESPVPTSGGEFSHANIFGRIVSAREAAGSVSFSPCVGRWIGGKYVVQPTGG